MVEEEVGLDKVDDMLGVYYDAPLHVGNANVLVVVPEEVAYLLPVLGALGHL